LGNGKLFWITLHQADELGVQMDETVFHELVFGLYESRWQSSPDNTCGTTNHGYNKALTPYANMDLQQPHIYFDAQIYASTHRYGY